MSIKCEWINKMEYNDLVFIHKKELLIQPTKWRNSNTLIKRNQTLKTTYCVFPFISVPRKCKTIVVKSRSVTAGCGDAQGALRWWNWVRGGVWQDDRALPIAHSAGYLKQVSFIVSRAYCNKVVLNKISSPSKF